MDEFEAILETGMAVELAATAVAQRGGKTVPCLNCKKPLIGPYCALCGQPRNTHRRSTGRLFRDLIKDIASFDSRILRTAYALLLRPGELALAFREGRLQRYVPPVRLYLFVSLLFFLMLSATHVALFQFVLQSHVTVTAEASKTEAVRQKVTQSVPPSKPDASHKTYNYQTKLVFLAKEGSVHSELAPDSLKNLNESFAESAGKPAEADAVTRTIFNVLLKLANDPAALNGALTNWIPRALFLLLPLFALILAAFFWRQKKELFFVDHLVFSLGFHSFAFALLLVAAALAQFAGGTIAFVSLCVALAAYLYAAMKRFYGQSWFWTGVKWFAVMFFYTSFCVLPAFAGVIIASVLWG